MWCFLDMAEPERQSSSAGAAIKVFNGVEEDVSLFEPLSGWMLLIEMMLRVVFLFVCIKLG